MVIHPPLQCFASCLLILSCLGLPTYEHQIVHATATQKSLAIELALQAAGMLTVEKTYFEYSLNKFNRQELNQFFNSKLSERTLYSLSFWDIGYTYEIGQAPTGDWLGIQSPLEFEYNS